MILSYLILTPFLGGVLSLLAGRCSELSHYIARTFVLLTAAMSCYLVYNFDSGTANMQFVEFHEWLPALGMSYKLGIDGISMPLIVLTAWINVVVIMTTKNLVKVDRSQYMAAFLILESVTFGLFSALDGILFYLFWEATLIPMYLCIGIWGGENRNFAAVKFFVYTFFGSAIMLLALIFLGIKAGTYDLGVWNSLPITLSIQKYLFIAFLLGFSIKVPMWPVHTWLPDAHTEAPTAGSVILAALMLKVGAYGFFRITMPVLPDASAYFSTFMIALSLIAIVYIGYVALAQKDIKRLIAYSSVAHMGFVTLGCFLVYKISASDKVSMQMAIEGAYMQMISHGFGSGALFLAFGLLYERYHSRDIASFGGIANVMPIFSAFFVLFAFANVGLPGTSGFVGEFMVIISSASASIWIAFIAGLTVIISAAYTLNMVRKVFYGPVAHKSLEELSDIKFSEKFWLSFLAAGVLILGFYPEGMLKYVHSSSQNLLRASLVEKS